MNFHRRVRTARSGLQPRSTFLIVGLGVRRSIGIAGGTGDQRQQALAIDGREAGAGHHRDCRARSAVSTGASTACAGADGHFTRSGTWTVASYRNVPWVRSPCSPSDSP